jgi:serine protease Do
VKVEVARKGGIRKTFDVKLQPLQDAPQVADNSRPGGDGDNAGTAGGFAMRRMGISVQPVTPQIAEQLQLPADARGLVITDVAPGGPGWDALLDESRGGPDIIVAVEGKPVKTEADLRAALKDQAPGSVVTLRLYNPRLGRRIERVKLTETP